MKFFKLLILLFVCFACKQTNKEYDLESKSLSELMMLGHDLTETDVFPEICKLLNDSILNKKRSFYMLPSMYSESIKGNDTILDFKLTFYHTDEFPLMDVVTLNIILDNDSIFFNNAYCEVDKINSIAKDFIFNPDPLFGYHAVKRYDTKYFGEIDMSIIIASLVAKIKEDKGLSTDTWRLYFTCLHELISIFEEKQNEMAMNKWNKNFNSLSDEKKIAILDVISYRIWLYFAMDNNQL